MTAQTKNVIDFSEVKAGNMTTMGMPTLTKMLSDLGTVEKPTHEVFGLDVPFEGKALSTVKVPAVAGHLPFVPKKNPLFKHDPQMVRLMLMAIKRGRPLMLSGPKGAGKTETVEQFYAALGLPCITIQCGPGIDTEYLFGRANIEDGNIGWVDGLATLARRCGFAFLLDEMDGLPSEMGPQVNGYLQMEKPFAIPGATHKKGIKQEELIIASNPTFQVYATTNTGGKSEGGVEYEGRSPIDQSTRDRFLHAEVDYMPRAQELTVLKAMVPNLEELAYTTMLDIADEIRALYKNKDAYEPISTRSVVMWAEMVEMTEDLHESFLYSCYYQSCEHDRALMATSFEAHHMTLQLPSRSK